MYCQKTNTGSLDQCPDNLVFPLYTKQQPSDSRLCCRIFSSGEFTSVAFPRHPRCDIIKQQMQEGLLLANRAIQLVEASLRVGLIHTA